MQQAQLTIDEAYRYLNTYGKSGKPVENLKRIRTLLDGLGNPQKKLRFIHVAGTNGKGSICEMLTEILTAQGYRVGTFTSPYVVDYSDRIRVGGKAIEAHYLTRHTQTVKLAAEKTACAGDYSQFEITMCIALMHFLERACDVVVWETGIGGLNDCTNVIEDPLVSVIASVSLDHTAVLGNTVEEIAVQKAGIIKENRPSVLSCANSAKVESIVRRTAICRCSRLTVVNSKNIRIVSDRLDGCEFTYRGKSYMTSMCGVHQAQNAASVIEALSACSGDLPVDSENIRLGIARAHVHARTEIISKDPLIILDGGHNPGGFQALADTLKSKTLPPRIAVIGMLREKNSITSIKQIAPLCDAFITVDGFHPNCISAGELAEEIRSIGKSAAAAESAEYAYRQLISAAGAYKTAVICGSLYLAGEILNCRA